MTIHDTPGMLTCPLCGGLKYVLALGSGNTFHGELWSDSQTYYPMLPSYSPIQKCSHCGHYYFFDCGHFDIVTMIVEGEYVRLEQPSFWDTLFNDGKIEEKPKKSPSRLKAEKELKRMNDEACRNGFGKLSYSELVEAEKDILKGRLSAKHKKDFLLTALYAFNDLVSCRHHTGYGLDLLDEHERTRAREYALMLIDCLGEEETLTAELYREIGAFDKSIDLCRKLAAKEKDRDFLQQIMERAERQDTLVFQLT